MKNKRTDYIIRLNTIADALEKSQTDKEINDSFAQLMLVLYDIQSDYSVLKEANKLIEKVTSFKKQSLPKEMLIYSIQCLSESISQSENQSNTSDNHRMALMQMIHNMSDEDVEALFASCVQQLKP